MLPPPNGAFLRGGAPWENVAAIPFVGTQESQNDWKVKAIRDESYLYVRIESKAPLLPPGSQTETFHTGWPVLRINIASVPPREFILNIGANIGDKSTFDEKGKAN